MKIGAFLSTGWPQLCEHLRGIERQERYAGRQSPWEAWIITGHNHRAAVWASARPLTSLAPHSQSHKGTPKSSRKHGIKRQVHFGAKPFGEPCMVFHQTHFTWACWRHNFKIFCYTLIQCRHRTGESLVPSGSTCCGGDSKPQKDFFPLNRRCGIRQFTYPNNSETWIFMTTSGALTSSWLSHLNKFMFKNQDSGVCLLQHLGSSPRSTAQYRREWTPLLRNLQSP